MHSTLLQEGAVRQFSNEHLMPYRALFSVRRMRTIVALLFICFLSGAPVFADPTSDQVRDLTLQGLDMAYHFRFSAAEQKFDQAVAISPSHPRPILGKAEVAFWNYILGRKDSLYKVFLQKADHAIDVAEQYIEKNGKDADALTCLGTVYGYRAFAHGRAKSYLKAAWDGRKSFDYFSDAARLAPYDYDAKLGMGIFHYVTSFLPKTFRYLVSILGISGDADQGIREMRLAREKSTYSKTEATYYLSQLLPWSTGDFTESESLIGELQKQYPENTLFEFSLAVLDIRRNDVGTARQRLLNVISPASPTLDGLRDFANYKLAECWFRSDSLAQARKSYEEFLREYDGDTYVATAVYRIGLSWELAGNREKAMKYYRRAAEADRSFGEDQYSARKARHFLNTPVHHYDSLLLAAENSLYSGRYDRAIDLFRQLSSSNDASADIVRRSEYGIGEALYEKKMFAEARETFRRLETEDVSGEQWLHPWSYYNAARCSIHLGDRTAALAELEHVTNYDDYDYENWLSFRTDQEIQKLKKEAGG